MGDGRWKFVLLGERYGLSKVPGGGAGARASA
jgi:hypothetical protein